MNKRAIINVATGEFYCKMQDRLIKSFEKSIDYVYVNGSLSPWRVSSNEILPIEEDPKYNNTGIDLIIWKDELPPGSRSHSESPYGFKVFAFMAAIEMGYTSILWLDSPAYAVKEDISPIFEKIEKEGYYAMSHVDPLENWVGNTALQYHRMQRDDLKGYNLPSGSCYGFDLSIKWVMDFFKLFITFEIYGLFKSEKISENGWHRHDEAVLALMLIKCNLPVFTFDPLFQSDSPECVIKSGGE